MSMFFISRLLVTCSVAVHLIHANADLLHAEQIDQTRVLPRLTLNLSSFVVALGNRCREVSVGGHHDQSNIRLGRTSDHIFDEVAMSWGVNNSVVPLIRVKFLGCTRPM